MIPNFYNYQIDTKKFTVIKKLGRGQSGVVYLVENPDDGRQYALKSLFPSSDFDHEKHINREINIMIRLNHPSVIKFYGYSIDDEDVSILMQYAQKGSLLSILKLIRSGKEVPGYDNTVRQKILIGIARGMMHLHNNNLVHRDIKPENIMLDGNFNPLVADFGLARTSEKKLGMTAGAGSPYYKAPEVLEKETDYDESVDVYSYGIMMYEIITDLVPFHELPPQILDNPYLFSDRVVVYETRPIFPEDFKITEELKILIQKCWSSKPIERPTFEEIFNKLAYDSGEPTNFKNLFENDDHKYYLEDVRQEEILSYVQELLDRENADQYMMKQSIIQLKEQVASIKQDSELAIDQIRSEIEIIKNAVLSRLQINLTAQMLPANLRTKEIKYNEGAQFEGILKYLTRLNQTNIYDNKTIKITTNSMHTDDIHYFVKKPNFYHPKNMIDYDKDNEYKSTDVGGAIVCFDFKDKFVNLSKYQIQTSMKEKSTTHLKNWVIEVSEDGSNWFEIDRRKNDESLNEPRKSNVFDIQNPNNNFYRYLRLRQIGTSHYNCENCNIFSISRFDFYGQIKVPQA